MATRRLRGAIGSRRLSRGGDTSIANATRQTRMQMKAIEDEYAKFVHLFKDATPEMLEFAVKPILDRSLELVPQLTGELYESGYIEAKRTPKGGRVTVGYAKGGVPSYAVYVHERMDLKHRAPTQAKFLQQAMSENIEEVPGRLKDWVWANELMSHLKPSSK